MRQAVTTLLLLLPQRAHAFTRSHCWFRRLERKALGKLLLEGRQLAFKLTRALGRVELAVPVDFPRLDARLSADPFMWPEACLPLFRRHGLGPNLLMLDARLGVLAHAVRRDDHLAGVDRRLRTVPALEDVPGAGDEEVVARIDEGRMPMHVVVLNRSRIGGRFLKLLGGLVIEFGMMTSGVMKYDLRRPAGGTNRSVRRNSTPLFAGNDPVRRHRACLLSSRVT